MPRVLPLAALLCAAAVAACEKNGVQQLTTATPSARIKFFNFGVGAPGVNFFVNDVKATGTSATTCTPPVDPACTTTGLADTIGTTSGNAASGALYAIIAPGQPTVSARTAARTDNGTVVTSLPVTVAGGKAYSFYVSGIYNAATKSADSFAVEDNYPMTIAAVDYTVAYVRFVNASPGAPAMTLFLKNTTTSSEQPIGAPNETVAYKSGGAFTPISPGTYDLNTRTAGSATNLITRTAVSFAAGRVYTITARGDFTVTSSTAATRRQLDNTANR